MTLISKKFTFSAAHKLPNYNGKCKNLHGHTYSLEVCIQGEVDKKTGMVMDFNDLKKIVEKKVIFKLDHSYLNDTIKNPTAENIACWIWNKLENFLPLYQVKVSESENNSVIYTK